MPNRRVVRSPLILVLTCISLAVGVAAASAWSSLPSLSEAQIEQYERFEADAMSAAKGGENAKAARLMAKAVRIYDGNDGTWYNLACTQALSGQTDAALQSLRRASATGWADPEWPAQDSDLEALHALPEFQEWVEALADAEPMSESWPTNVVEPATTEEELTERGDARAEQIKAYRRVLGGKDYAKLSRELDAWKAASWDAIADATADPQAKARAKHQAIAVISGRYPIYANLVTAEEMLRRADEFQLQHASSDAMVDVLTLAAQARFAHNRRSDDEVVKESAEATFERDLLMVTSAYQDGGAVEDALVHLIDMNADDLAAAGRLYARLKSIGETEDVRKKMLANARGMYYQIEGMPEFTATTTAGDPIGRADLNGKVTLVDFWATWCGPCKVELPYIKETYERYHAEGFDILGISLDNAEDLDEAGFLAWLEKNEMGWPQIYDGKGWESELAVHFGVKSIPFALLLDRDGNVVASDKALRGEMLAETVGAAMTKGTQRAAR